MIKQKNKYYAKLFFILFFIVVNPYIAKIYFYFGKNKYYAKKYGGGKNSITILYIMLIRHGTIGRQTLYIYILLYSSLLSSSYYYTRETRTRILLLLYCFILLRFLLLLLFYLLLHYTLFLYIHILNQIQTKTNYLWSLIPLPHICPSMHIQLVLILHRSAFSPFILLRPKIKACQ